MVDMRGLLDIVEGMKPYRLTVTVSQVYSVVGGLGECNGVLYDVVWGKWLCVVVGYECYIGSCTGVRIRIVSIMDEYTGDDYFVGSVDIRGCSDVLVYCYGLRCK